MKLLKTLFLFLAMMYAGNSYAQTKEETIEWLNRNGKAFLRTTECERPFNDERIYIKYFIEIEKDILKVFEDESFSKRTGRGTYFKYVNWNQILYEDVSTVPVEVKTSDKCPEFKYFKLKVLGYKYGYKPDDKEVRNYEDCTNECTIYLAFDSNNLENAKRSLKAILHLAKLSGAKENKQTF